MKIVKCKGCSGNTHIFTSAPASAGGVKCLFCGKPVDIAEALDNSFKAPFLFLNDKLAAVDKLIADAKFGDAKTVIDEVLEAAPGPGVGDLPGGGEVHWRKLLVEVGCRNDAELLGRGKLLGQYPAFINAVKYGNDDEKRVYVSVEERKRDSFTKIKSVLEKGAVDEKLDAKAESLLGEYKEELVTLQEQAQADVARLERIEEEIREEVIDCGIVLDEYKNTIDAINSAVDGMKNVGSEITLEQRDSYMKRARDMCSLSDQEVDAQKKLESGDEHYLKYSELKGKQSEAVSAVRNDVSKINAFRQKIAGFLERIDAITKKYADAISALEGGNYEPARALLQR